MDKVETENEAAIQTKQLLMEFRDMSLKSDLLDHHMYVWRDIQGVIKARKDAKQPSTLKHVIERWRDGEMKTISMSESEFIERYNRLMESRLAFLNTIGYKQYSTLFSTSEMVELEYDELGLHVGTDPFHPNLRSVFRQWHFQTTSDDGKDRKDSTGDSWSSSSDSGRGGSALSSHLVTPIQSSSRFDTNILVDVDSYSQFVLDETDEIVKNNIRKKDFEWEPPSSLRSVPYYSGEDGDHNRHRHRGGVEKYTSTWPSPLKVEDGREGDEAKVTFQNTMSSFVYEGCIRNVQVGMDHLQNCLFGGEISKASVDQFVKEKMEVIYSSDANSSHTLACVVGQIECEDCRRKKLEESYRYQQWHRSQVSQEAQKHHLMQMKRLGGGNSNHQGSMGGGGLGGINANGGLNDNEFKYTTIIVNHHNPSSETDEPSSNRRMFEISGVVKKPPSCGEGPRSAWITNEDQKPNPINGTTNHQARSRRRTLSDGGGDACSDVLLESRNSTEPSTFLRLSGLRNGRIENHAVIASAPRRHRWNNELLPVIHNFEISDWEPVNSRGQRSSSATRAEEVVDITGVIAANWTKVMQHATN